MLNVSQSKNSLEWLLGGGGGGGGVTFKWNSSVHLKTKIHVLVFFINIVSVPFIWYCVQSPFAPSILQCIKEQARAHLSATIPYTVIALGKKTLSLMTVMMLKWKIMIKCKIGVLTCWLWIRCQNHIVHLPDIPVYQQVNLSVNSQRPCSCY